MADNRELARLFREIAVLLELKDENPFKIRAYESAARILGKLTEELATFVASGHIDETKGIGKAIGQKIREYAATGRLEYYEQLRDDTPPALFEFVGIRGLGPKRALQLIETLDIASLGELEYACRENRLAALPGFGAKVQAKILAGIEERKKYRGRLLLADVWPLSEKIAEFLRRQPGVAAAETIGDIRLRRETVEQLELLVAAERPEELGPVLQTMPGVVRMEQGQTSAVLILTTGQKVLVRLCRPEAAAAQMVYYTCAAEHLVGLQRLAEAKGWRLDEEGLTDVAGHVVALRGEQDVYRQLGLPMVPPELREDAASLTAAQTGQLPVLIDLKDIRGVLHVHTEYSDGRSSLTEMVKAARRRGWTYLGITDHSRTAVYAGGLSLDDVRRQRAEIDRLNAADNSFRILAGIESDILSDGSLDYPDEVLAGFDFVIASIHSGFRMTEREITRRIVRAITNPYVSILGHPTGRILLAREGYPVDLGEVIAAAAASGTVLELNASPFRLDLDWRWCRKAKAAGVVLSVNPDAHGPQELDHMAIGVAMARKGGLGPDDILTTRPAAELAGMLRRKRRQG